MRNQNEKRFCNVAHKVFNNDGTIRVCGRDSVRALDPTKDFGNKEIGRMNVDTVRELLAEVEKKH